MDKITVGFAIECAKDPALWDKYFKGKTLLDVLMTAKEVSVEMLIRAGVTPEVAVEKMAERQEGHFGCGGRRTIFVNGKNRSNRSLVEKVTPSSSVKKVIIHKKDGSIIARQRYSTGKIVAWNAGAKK